MNTYDKIETVMKAFDSHNTKNVAPHEFRNMMLGQQDGLQFVGCSESTLGRRMREMVEAGRLTRKIRDGKTFKEFALAVKPCPAPEVEQPAAHSGGY